MKKGGKLTCLLFCFIVLVLLSPEQGENEQQHNGARDAHKELAPPGGAHRQAELAEDPAAQEAADETDDNADQKAHAFTHDSAGNEACQCSDKD